MTPAFRILSLLALPLAVLTPAAHSQGRPEVVQELDGLLRPTSAAFSPDQNSLFVVNHARGGIGTLEGKSFLSKFHVDAEGEVTADQIHFVEKLTAPVDLDFSPIAFGSIPPGSIFVIAGTPLVQDQAGRLLKDLSEVTVGLLVIDPNSGEVLKQIDLGPNSGVQLREGKTLLAPTSLSFDKRGNLYIGESGLGGHMFPDRQVGNPGIWRLEAGTVVELIEGGSPDGVEFIRTTSMPGDMSYRASEDMMYFVTNHGQGRPTGSVFRIRADNYAGMSSMQTIVRDLEALSGIQITPTGRVLLIGNSGELLLPKGKKRAKTLHFRPKTEFSSPGKPALMTLEDGQLLLAVPEQSSNAGYNRGQRVRIVTLPEGY